MDHSFLSPDQYNLKYLLTQNKDLNILPRIIAVKVIIKPMNKKKFINLAF